MLTNQPQRRALSPPPSLRVDGVVADADVGVIAQQRLVDLDGVGLCPAGMQSVVLDDNVGLPGVTWTKKKREREQEHETPL